jgi:hypothetical protein
MRNRNTRTRITAAGFLIIFGLTPWIALAGPAQPQKQPAGKVAATTQTRTHTQNLEEEEEGDYYLPDVALALKVGTLGPGVELTLGVIEEALNVRVGGNYMHLRFSGKIKDVDYGVELNMASVPLMLDYHPFYNNFRITGGVMYNNNRASLDGNLNDVQKIGDHEYTPEEIGTLTGSVDFRKFAPYIGIGFGNAVGPDTSWNFVFDLGIMFQGVPGISLTADGTMSGDPTFQADLAKEEANVQDEADKFQFYPVLSIGISYQF